ncbi:MAG: GerMN domain-containing protein [Proteocatella sp.]
MRKKIIPMMLVLLILLVGCSSKQEIKDNESNLSEKQNINLYYPNIDDEKYYFKTVEITINKEDNIADIIVEAYKTNAIKGTGRVLSENTRINKIYLDEKGVLNIDFNKEFITEMNAGASYEELILHSVANTFGEYYKADKIAITIEEKPYESGHILLGKDDYIDTDYTNVVKVDENSC